MGVPGNAFAKFRIGPFSGCSIKLGGIGCRYFGSASRIIAIIWPNRLWKRQGKRKKMDLMQQMRSIDVFMVPGAALKFIADIQIDDLPAAIACRLILEGKFTRKGVVVPVTPDIYEPILEELEELGIRLVEEIHRI